MRAEPDRKQNDGAGEVQHIVRDVDPEDSQEHRKRWRAGGLSQVGYSWGRGSSPNFAHAASYTTTISRRISGRSEIGPDHGTVTEMLAGRTVERSTVYAGVINEYRTAA